MSSAASRVFQALRGIIQKKPRVDRFKADPAIASTNTQPTETLTQPPPIEPLIEKEPLEVIEKEPIKIEDKEPIKIKEPIQTIEKPAPINEPVISKVVKSTTKEGGAEIRKPATVLKAVKPHLPMIKFRKGSLIPKAVPVVNETTVAPVAAAPAASSSGNKWTAEQVVNLEWWQTPLKFKRRDVDNLEIDLINSGGADKVYQ